MHGTDKRPPRRNGWSWPPHPAQIALCIFPVCYAAVFLSSCPPSLPFIWRPAAYIIYCSLSAFFAVNYIISTSLNAAERSVRVKWGSKAPRIFEKAGKVIVNAFCYICEARVSPGTKHCGQCNKCVKAFDHHCMWFNNCVGSRNYNFFIYSLTSGIILLFIMLFSSVFMVIISFANESKLKSWIGSTSNTYDPKSNISLSDNLSEGFPVFVEVPKAAFLVAMLFMAIIAIVALGFTGHLLCFHIYLRYHGITTYQYIVAKRKKLQPMNTEEPGRDAPPAAVEKSTRAECLILSPTGISTNTENSFIAETILSSHLSRTKDVVPAITDNSTLDDSVVRGGIVCLNFIAPGCFSDGRRMSKLQDTHDETDFHLSDHIVRAQSQASLETAVDSCHDNLGYDQNTDTETLSEIPVYQTQNGAASHHLYSGITKLHSHNPRLDNELYRSLTDNEDGPVNESFIIPRDPKSSIHQKIREESEWRNSGSFDCDKEVLVTAYRGQIDHNIPPVTKFDYEESSFIN